MINDQPRFAGVDVGSLTAEALIIDEAGTTLAAAIIRVRPRPEQSAAEAFDRVLSESGLSRDEVDLCFSTGYGRDAISFSAGNISEISCHGRGAHHLLPAVRTIIDIGGQDCKVIRVDNDGHLHDFIMNDKCAAGTGRFLEMMARTLNVELSELGNLAVTSKPPLSLSSICTIFAEMEVMQLIYAGKKKKNIAAGIHLALARRIKSLVGRVGLVPDICMTGGVSKNRGVVTLLEKELGVSFAPFSLDPQLIGALGAALFAKDAWQRRKARNG